MATKSSLGIFFILHGFEKFEIILHYLVHLLLKTLLSSIIITNSFQLIELKL